MEFKMLKREIETEQGKEVIVEKRYNLFKDQWQNRLWVFQPQDPILADLDKRVIWS